MQRTQRGTTNSTPPHQQQCEPARPLLPTQPSLPATQVIAHGSYSEAEARQCFIQLLRGIQYLHAAHVVHRDLKLENLLLVTPGDITNIKIADFGLAKQTPNSQLSTICGTPQYVAPEVIRGSGKRTVYGPECDMW